MDFITKAEHKMMGDLWISTELWKNTCTLCDDCQGRFAGSDDERRAGSYIRQRLSAYGLDKAAAEPFELRGWERGETRLTLLDGSQERELTCLGLSGTAPCHLETEIIDVGQAAAADFERLGSAVAGKIIVTSPEGPARWERIQNAINAGAAVGSIPFQAQGGHPICFLFRRGIGDERLLCLRA